MKKMYLTKAVRITIYTIILCFFLVSPRYSLASSVEEMISDANQIIDNIDNGNVVSKADMDRLQSYMDTVNKIPEQNLNDATKDLISKYESSTKIRSYQLGEEINRLEDVNAGIIEDMQDSNISGTAKARLHQELINNQGKLSVLKYEKDYVDFKPGCRPYEATRCLPYCKYTAKDKCTLCSLFSVMFNTVSAVTDKSVRTFSSAISVLVIVGFGVWLAIQILSFVSSIETKDIKDLLQSMITQGFVVLIAFMILRSGVGSFFDTFIEPFYASGQSLAQEALSNCPPPTADANGSEQTTVCEEYSKIKNASAGIIKTEQGLPPSMGESIVKTMTLMENRIRRFKALGESMMCKSWQDAVFLFPKWIYFFTGIIIWVLSLFLMFGIPFLMIDAVLQLGVAGALLPIAVGGFAFKATRQYTKKVWETFLNSMFIFLFITIVVLVILGVLQQSIDSSVTTIDSTGMDFDDLFAVPSEEVKIYYEKILESFQWLSPHFLKLAFVFLLAWSVLKMAKEFADEFASSISSTEIGSSIGTMAASAAKGMTKKVAQPLASAASSHIGRAVRSRIFAGNRAFRRAKYKSELKKFDNVASKNGVKEYTDKKGRIHRLENGVATIIQNKNGKEVKQIISENFTITQTKQVKMVNGKPVEVYREKLKLNNRQLDRVINERGEFNKQELDKMYQGLSAEQKKIVQKAVTRALIEKRVSKSAHDFSQANSQAPEIISTDDASGEVVMKQVTAKGEVVFSRMRINSAGLMETEMTKIDEKGRVTRMTSDGIHNKMEKFTLQEGTDSKNLKNLQEVQNNRKKDSKGRYEGTVSYGYSKYYRDYLDRGGDPRRIPPGALDQQEAANYYDYYRSKGNEFGKANMNINFK